MNDSPHRHTSFSRSQIPSVAANALYCATMRAGHRPAPTGVKCARGDGNEGEHTGSPIQSCFSWWDERDTLIISYGGFRV